MTETIPPPPPIQQRHLNQTNLSFSQESLWFLQQLDPQNTAYNSNFLLRFIGNIDPSSLERALNELVRRHEPFRATYPNKGGKPIQVIHPFEPFPLPYLDFSELPGGEQEQAVKRYYSEQGNLPFNLQQGPAIRFARLHLAENENYLFFGTHHIGSDAWSREIVIGELMQLYDAFRSGRAPLLPDLPIQFTDYALWEREWLNGKTLATYIDHWKNILSGDLPILELPTDRPRPAVQSSRGAQYRFQLPQVLSSQLKVFCRKEHLTLFQPLLAAYALLLTRYTGLEDIIIGCPFANRSRPELNGLVGLFVNTLPIRINLIGNPSVRTFLKQVREVMLDAFSWQAAPFEALVSKISPKRDLSHTPVFQVMITLRNVPKHKPSIEGLKVESIHREAVTSQFDLSLEFDVGEDEELECSLNYNVDLYDENTIIHMVAHYQNLLKELLTNPDCPITDLEMLIPSEWQRIVIDWNDTNADYPREKCVHQIIEEQVERTPDSPAVLFGKQKLTYRELNERANQIAHHLRKMGAGPEVPVGMYLERSAELAVTILGILKAGSPYVPLDTIYPLKRRAEIIHDSGMKILVTQNALMNDEFENDLTLLCLDEQQKLLETESIQNPAHIGTPENLAYIIYTSGSTGKPKGVEISHRSLVNCLLSANKQISLSTGNLSLAVFSPTFDVSVFDLLSPLCLGATVAVASREEMYDGAQLAKRIMELPLTWMSASPATWRILLETGWQGKAGLKIISTGEALPPDLANRLMEINDEVYNLYGPTEATIWCAGTRLTPGQPVTIGRPIANTRLYILDSHLKPVPVGVAGELYIGGDGLARGYHNRADLTAEKFIPDPFSTKPGGCLYRTGDLAHFHLNGEIDILGRSDFQVKIRGYRIELGEIETTIRDYQGIRQAIVVVREDQPGDKRLVAYLLAATNTTLDMDKLRSFLREKLPDYMVPSFFMQIESFALTINGKLDRQALPRPEKSLDTNRQQAPRNETETRLVSLWKEVLGTEQVGIRDNFFELGGHSLLAVRLFARIQDEFGLSLPLQILFNEGTVEALANAITHFDNPFFLQGITPIRPEGSKTPLFIISPQLLMRELAFNLAPGRPVYGIAPVENGKEVYRKSVQDTAIIYYHNLVDFYPQGPYLLIGHSGRGLFTLELARVLLQNDKDVAFLGLLDTRIHSDIPPVKRLKFHTNNLMGKNLPQMLQYTKISLQRFSTRARIKILNPKTVERYQKEGRVRGQEVMNHLMRIYVPKPYPGQATLFSIANPPSETLENPKEQWADTFIGQLDIVTVPGDHVSMLKQPHVTVLAEKIDALLPPD